MKTSLSYLPTKKQFKISQIVDIIKEIVNPEMVILFGSYAKGKQVEHKYKGRDGIVYEYMSDYDFLVVTQKNTKETSEQEWKIEEATEKFDPPLNLEIHEIEYINKGLEFGQYFFTDIINEGVVLFDTGNTKFTVVRELTKLEEKEIAQMYFDKWFLRAKGFLQSVLFNYSKNEFAIAAFELHQTTERFYNTVLLVFTGYKPKTHNLNKLRRKAKHISEELFLLFPVETNKHEKQLFELLKQSYIDARYKMDYEITSEDLMELIEHVQKMEKIVEEICKQRIVSFG